MMEGSGGQALAFLVFKSEIMKVGLVVNPYVNMERFKIEMEAPTRSSNAS